MPRKKAESDKKYECWSCGAQYNTLTGNFVPTNLPLFKHYGYYPVCKECTDEFFLKMKEHFGDSEKEALKYLCMMYGLYYHPNPFYAALKKNSYKTKINTYVSMIQVKPWTGKCWLDTLEEKINPDEETKEEENPVITNEMKKFWGAGYSDQDYLMLQSYYDGYIKIHEGTPDIKTQKIMKTLSLTEYQIQKNMQNNKDIGALVNSYKSQLAELETDSADVANDTLGKWIFDIEKYCPADYYADKNKYHDFFGIIEYIERFLYRPLKNLLFNTKEPEKEYWVPEDTIESESIKNA